MNTWRISKVLLLVLASGTVGWWLNAPGPAVATSPPLPVAPAAPPPGATADPAPLIAVASDGNVTLRVEQRPLEWVLEQIAMQTGAPVDAAAPPAASRAAAAAPEPLACMQPPPPDAALLLRGIEGGDEQARHDGLLQARGAGVAIPDQTLKTLFETDASERVRMLAFENFLEARAHSPQAMRDTLQSALYIPDRAIQAESARLLSQLHEVERIDADSVQHTEP